MIITLDGPAGSGKSSTARAVARRLGFHHLDSGAFYRALTYAALRAGIPPARWPDLTPEELDALAVRAVPDDDGYRLEAAGDDVTAEIRSAAVNAHVSLMARVPAVRGWLLGRLRAAARGIDLITDGRDMGTVVFPDAELKVFLVADPRVRARRRLAEEGARDPDSTRVEAEAWRLLERDRLDSDRDIAPLRQAGDAVVLDTSELDFEEQVQRVVALARARGAT